MRFDRRAPGIVTVLLLAAAAATTGDTGEGQEPSRPIDDALFVHTATSPVRSFTKQVVIAAPRQEVWAAWTTPAGWGRIYGPPSAARIDLVIGGRYEWLFDGTIGSNGCQVLSFIPNRMVSFSWNAPPDQPESRRRCTWVVVELTDQPDGGTLVRVTHLGFGEGPAWDVTYRYFDDAWDRVLQRMQDRLPEPATTAD